MQKMQQNQTAVSVLGPNDLPEEIRSKIKFLEPDQTVRIMKKNIRTATEIYTGPGGVAYARQNQPIASPEYLQKAWQITHENKIYRVGFVKGMKIDGSGPDYVRPFFKYGEILLSGNSPDDVVTYAMLQLHPEFEGSLFQKGTAQFYQFNPDTAVKAEADRADKQFEALTMVNSLKSLEIKGLGSILGFVGTDSQILSQLKSLASKDPYAILSKSKDLTALAIRATVQSAFELKILVSDLEKKQIIDTTTNKPLVTFDESFAPENQEEAVKGNLVSGVLSKDKNALSAYSAISRKVKDALEVIDPDKKVTFRATKEESTVDL
jgi:hypothetical protein